MTKNVRAKLKHCRGLLLCQERPQERCASGFGMSAMRMSSGMAKLASDWEWGAASSAARKGPAVDGSHGGVALREGRSDFFERCDARKKSKNQPPAQNIPQRILKNIYSLCYSYIFSGFGRICSCIAVTQAAETTLLQQLQIPAVHTN